MLEFSSSVLGFVLTLMLHASVLLGVVWLLESLNALKHAGWAELAWRGALFGGLLSAAVATVATTPRGVVESHAPPSASHPAPPMLLPTTSSLDAPATRKPDRVVTARPTYERIAAPTPPASSSFSTPRSATANVALPRTVVIVAVQAWLAATMAWLLLTGWRTASVVRLLHRARHQALASAVQREQANAIAQQLALPAPRLHLDPTLASPVALPGRTVLLPRWSAELPLSESRALLAHELAHLARRDPFWRIAQHLALAPLCLNPLAWLALRRLDELAEREADAIAARLLGDGRPLAECLARCLAERVASIPTVPRFALAMAERPGAVVDRVQRLLEEDPMEYQPPSKLRSRLILAFGLVAAFALPGIAVNALAGRLQTGHSVSINSDNGRETVSIQDERGDYALDLEMEGKIEFSPDESDVIGMAADAKFELTEIRAGVTRSITFTSTATGVARDYRVAGKSHAFDAEGRAWLALALPEIFRNAGIDVEGRSGRILARGGPDALLDEVSKIESDYVRARYLGVAYTLTTLDATQLSRALELTRAIESDYEKRQALGAALASQQLVPQQQWQVLDLAQSLSSDYERAELLIQTADRFTLDGGAFGHWAKVLKGIGSDYEQRRVLEALLARSEDRVGAVRLAFNAARDIDSDYEKRQLLEAGVTHAKSDPGLRQDYLRVAADIDSDYERKEALLTLLRGGPVDRTLALSMLDAIDGIGSSHEGKEALLALAKAMPADAALIERYRASARRLSDYERGEAERALDRLVVVN